MDMEFFKEQGRIQASLKNVQAQYRPAKLGPAMDNVRNLWCLDCPLMQQCAEWAVKDKHTGIAGGEWFVDGEKQ